MFAWPALTSAGLAAIGYLPTRQMAGEQGIQAMIWALAGVTLVVYATLLPTMIRMNRADASKRLILGFRVMAIRFPATLALAAMVSWRRLVEPGPFLVWVAIAYMVLAMIESVILVRWNNRLGNQT